MLRKPPALLLLVFASLAWRASALPWTTHGPIGGPVFQVVAAPSNPSVLYVTTPAGVFRSDDRGVTWRHGNASLTSLRLTIDPTNENIVYGISNEPDSTLGTGIGHLFKSRDGGMNWEELTSTLPSPLRPGTLVIDPRDSNTLYLGLFCGPISKMGPLFHQAAGVFKSIDGGATWTFASNGLTASFALCVGGLTIDPVTGRLFSEGAFGSASRSDDGSASWSPLITRAATKAIVADPRTSRRYGFDSRSTGFHLLSSDDGITWRETPGMVLGPSPGKNVRNTVLTIDPSTGRLFLGTSAGLYRSGDGGRTWLAVDGFPHETIFSVVFDPSAGALSVSSAAGVHQSTSLPWLQSKEPATGSIATAIDTLTADPTNQGTLYAASRRHVYRTSDFGFSWQLTPSLPPAASFSSDPEIGRLTVAADGVLSVVARQNETGAYRLFRLGKDASQWVVRELPPPVASQTATPTFLLADPKTPDTLYAGIRAGVARTRDGGLTWEDLPYPSTQSPNVLAVDPDHPTVLYAGGSGLFKSIDAGSTWNRKALQYSHMIVIEVSPVDPSLVFIAARESSGKLVTARSEDGGETWTTIAPYAADIVSDLRDAGTVYLVSTNFPELFATYFFKVLRSRDRGQTFESIDQGLPPNSARVLAIDSGGALLHVGTGERGVWELRLGPRGRPARR